jgi:DNA polymerase III subunit gamma/tau
MMSSAPHTSSDTPAPGGASVPGPGTVVLARKYRPRNFAQMVGQEHVVQALSNALQTNRLHHAYLFTGTRGIGKTTVSRILAKSLNCTGLDGNGGITAEPCGQCQACREIDADRYIDYIELDAASNRSIDEIRDLIERAAYKPGLGRFKVFMIDEAHQLTKDAFNALLKTLEEPPDYLKFVLATTDPEKMLPTVLSRCLQFNLRPMAPSTVREHLARVLTAENVPHDEASLRLLGRAARGSMRDGLSLADQAIAYGGGKLEETVVRSMLGSVERGRARELVQALAARDGPALLAAVEGLRSRGQSASGTLDELAQLLQQAAVEQAVPGALDAADPETEDARAVAPLLAPDETQLLYSMALRGRDELALMGDEHAALTMVLLRFWAFPSEGRANPAPTQESRAAAPASAALRAPAPPATASRPVPLPAQTAAMAPAAQAAQAVPKPSTSTAAPAPARAQTAAAAPASSPVQTPPNASSTVPAAPVSAPPPVLPNPRLALGSAAPAPQAGAAAVAATASMAATAASVADAGLGISAGAASAPSFDSALGDRWQALVLGLIQHGSVQAMVRELAWSSALLAIDEQTSPPTWRLAVEREALRQPALRDKLQAAVSSSDLESALQLELVAAVPQDSPSKRDAAAVAQRQAQAVATIQDDPVVRELLARYKGARIVPGSIKPI